MTETIKPVRLQLSRRRGFSLQALSLATNGLSGVNCARPGPWGNPFVVGQNGARSDCVKSYQYLLGGFVAIIDRPTPDDQIKALNYAKKNIESLRGRNLFCWCNGEPCHASVLLSIANEAALEAVKGMAP